MEVGIIDAELDRDFLVWRDDRQRADQFPPCPMHFRQGQRDRDFMHSECAYPAILRKTEMPVSVKVSHADGRHGAEPHGFPFGIADQPLLPAQKVLLSAEDDGFIRQCGGFKDGAMRQPVVNAIISVSIIQRAGQDFQRCAGITA
ncbi:hypothetical protein NBRC3278_3063 [Acetobacter pasteurianus NBRC 3278]|uniref:Uncharacterized protein n=1 Tax=Acetobacter pasteurianus NBRC 3278 TaxID=1226660 RepID=A0A401X7Y1_ACEPA|nr:hypothetical protein NBRC3277_3000 [Acetobacter pasteurianus NBRC 3277]GCD63970.1 hypothetical protein NBRC3278_3063 [Acetobacter pasteurianus NBRC 3278]